jgi:signal transduction histidine kinase
VNSALKKIAIGSGLYYLAMRIKSLKSSRFFFIIAAVVFAGYAMVVFVVTRDLRDETADATKAYTTLIETMVASNMSYDEATKVLKNMIGETSPPLIVTDTAGKPIIWENVYTDLLYNKKDLKKLAPENRRDLENKIDKFKKKYHPRPLYNGDNNSKAGYLFFGNTKFMRSMYLLPFLEIGLGVVFVIFIYIAFRIVRVTERSNLWVGLAKETAHQLGTPISSLMGWVEYMRTYQDADPPIEALVLVGQLQRICDDMDNDLKRLSKVTNRFSQIGSIPALSPCDVNEVLRDVANYFRVRLPLLRKKIEIRFSFGEIPQIDVNRDLLEWVFENLMKNSIDAMNRDDGLIEIKTEFSRFENRVRIHHIDNGKGVPKEAQKSIFAPGYTTKKRGWGLGLTLAKRIVEDYHRGKIFVNWSQKDKGTVFFIELPAVNKTAPG